MLGFVVALLVCLAIGCRSAPAPLDDSNERHGSPYAELVAKHAGSSLDERLQVYLPLARKLAPGGPKFIGSDGDLRTLAADLADGGEYVVLEALEKEVAADADRRWALWYAVSRSCVGGGKPKRALLGKWARANPDEILLARWRRGGIDYLFSRLEDLEEEPFVRWKCAQEIAKSGDPAVLPRLKKSMNDTTAAVGVGFGHSEPDIDVPFDEADFNPPTVGDLVRDEVERLEQAIGR